MSNEDRRKLMQIGFAALLARKQKVQKKYLYEDRTDGGFVFEPILPNNTAEMADEEFMRKRYYSQVVYDATMDGSIETSIQEPDPNQRAARRLWAGRAGTGWNGTGRGGYMESLQPGTPETEGTGLGSAAKEADLLMQVYLEKQAEKMHILKGKSEQATADLFKKVAEHAQKVAPDKNLGFKEYLPSFEKRGIPFNKFKDYLRPELSEQVTKKEWIENAVRKINTSLYRPKGLSPNKSSLYTSYGSVQGEFAEKLAGAHPDKFSVEDYRRITTMKDPNKGPTMYSRQPTKIDKFGQISGFDEKDIKNEDGFSDYVDIPHYGQQYGPRSGGQTSRVPEGGNRVGGRGGQGGEQQYSTNQERAPQHPKYSIFEKRTLDEMFPKAWQEYSKQKRLMMDEVHKNSGQLLNQKGADAPYPVQVGNVAEAREFVKWMVKTVNDEQAKLNAITPPSGPMHPYDKNWKMENWSTKIPSMSKFKGDYGSFGGFSTTHQYLAGGISAGMRKNVNDYKAEIVKGFGRDFGILNDEVRYLKSNDWLPLKDRDTGKSNWLWKNQQREKRGVDMYIPVHRGLLKIHVSVKIVPENRGTKKSQAPTRAYAKLDVYAERRGKPQVTSAGVEVSDPHFIPDVSLDIQDEEIFQMKGEEAHKRWVASVENFYTQGAMSQYMGGTMITQGGGASRMFMGDMSPAQSVGFFTNTKSTGDFADQLKTLVDIGAKEWWQASDGFNGYFDLDQMEGGAFKEWAIKWQAESNELEDSINKDIENRWAMWVSQYAGGGATAPAPRIAKSWDGAVKLGPFVHSTKSLEQTKTVGMRPHGYYRQGGGEYGPLG